MTYLASSVKLPEGSGPIRAMVCGTLGEQLLVGEALDAGHARRPFVAIVHGGDAAGEAAGRWAAARGVPVEDSGAVDVLIVFRRIQGDVPEADAQAAALGVPLWVAFRGFPVPQPLSEKWSRHSYGRRRR